MTDSARWVNGVYQGVENEDPNAFHLLVDKSFSKKDVNETISSFEAMVLHVNYPLDLLRVTSKVITTTCEIDFYNKNINSDPIILFVADYLAKWNNLERY